MIGDTLMRGNKPILHDPYFANVKLLLQNEAGVTVDSSTANTPVTSYTWTGNGTSKSVANSAAVQQSTFGVNGNSGKSAHFPDGKSYLSTNASLSFSGDWTMEGWINYQSMSSGGQLIFGFRTASTPQPFGVYINANSNNLLQMFYNSTFVTGTIVMPLNAWTHVAATRSGSTVSLWMNGVLAAPTISSTVNEVGSVGIGYYTFNYTQFDQPFIGYMDDVRFTAGICRYTTTFTPPSSPFPTRS